MAEISPSEQVIYLHGDIELHVVEARSLPNMDVLIGHFRRCVTLEACRKPGGGGGGSGGRKIEHHRRKIITSDTYVKVSAPQATLARTCVLSNSRNPKWEEHFDFSIAHPLVNLEFRVKDDDTFGADVMGTVL